MSTDFKFFHALFKRVSRPDREKILCAMIRVNYGTPWDGDLAILKSFFPESHHEKLTLGGITALIEALSPFADEPTDAGFVADEKTLRDAETTNTLEMETENWGELTQDLPVEKSLH